MNKMLMIVRSFGVSAMLALTVLPIHGFAATAPNAKTDDSYRAIFAPENDVKIPVGFGAYSVEESMFNRVIDRAEKFYTPVFAAQGRQFSVERRWTDATANAFADRAGTKSMVHMFGGLARHPMMTEDGFTLVICHEIGHHLGGAPKVHQFIFFTSWAANEGEADYFSTMKCARELWKSDDNAAIVSIQSVDQVAKNECQKAWSSSSEVALCMRSAAAGQSLGDTLADLSHDKIAPTFSTPDDSQVRKTFDAHPQAQCRLDTYIAGALCGVSKDVKFNEKDATVGACNASKGNTVGARPACWYAPVAKK